MATKSIVVNNMDFCLACGKYNAECHHVFFGENRKHSDRLGLVIPLCYEHHRTGRQSPHQNREVDLAYKRKGQLVFEQKIGTREQFMEIFGRNYLD